MKQEQLSCSNIAVSHAVIKNPTTRPPVLRLTTPVRGMVIIKIGSHLSSYDGDDDEEDDNANDHKLRGRLWGAP